MLMFHSSYQCYCTVLYCARSTVNPTGNNTEGIILCHLIGLDLAPADCLF